MAMYQLRDYQQDAVTATLSHFRSSDDPAVIVLPTGAGKSLVIAELSHLAKGKVLCLAHVKELVEQNHAKFCLTGNPAGIFSAGLKQKNNQHPVTFASVQSIAPNLSEFNSTVSLLIIDECHRISTDDDSQYLAVVQHFRALNPHLKILGLTATPFRLSTGWIYQTHYYGFARTAQDTFFKRCIYELPLRFMIKHDYLTQPVLFDAAIAHYDFSKLDSTSNDIHKEEQSLNELIGKYPRVTQAIIEQIIELSHDRQGVMIFASTIQHAQEIMSYLQQQNAAFIQGATTHIERDAIIKAFKAKKLKYLVNVSVLTTGFDAPHVDVIAILRPTQSISLFQQIVGRGLRLSDNKQDCLILDYANNGYDLYAPEVGEKRPSADSVPVQVQCPSCEFANTFWGKCDDQGAIIEHYGRRCHGLIEQGNKEVQCEYRFRFKLCQHCNNENDIAARICQQCQQLLIDPDDLLKRALNLKNSKVIRCAGLKTQIIKTKLKVIYFDEDGEELTENFDMSTNGGKQTFNQLFARRLAQGTQPVTFTTIGEVKPFLNFLPHPDFVIAQKQGQYWKVSERLFDYQGPYRKANALH